MKIWLAAAVAAVALMIVGVIAISFADADPLDRTVWITCLTVCAVALAYLVPRPAV
jgi:VIT1/CCC1 family predicted Fe2+/Mn2+ transporter